MLGARSSPRVVLAFGPSGAASMPTSKFDLEQRVQDVAAGHLDRGAPAGEQVGRPAGAEVPVSALVGIALCFWAKSTRNCMPPTLSGLFEEALFELVVPELAAGLPDEHVHAVDS